METLLETKTENIIVNNQNDVCVVVMLVNNTSFNVSGKSYDLKICGKSMKDWVLNTVYDANIKTVEVLPEDDFLDITKMVVDKESEYTVVLYSDTPLLQRKTYLQILEYVKMKKLSVLKLTRGYVFETKYLLTIDKLLCPQMQYFEEEDFITCYSLKQFSIITEIMKNRILNYFLDNGVVIEDLSSVYIDADVTINPNVLIKSNNRLTKGSVLLSGVTLESGNTICSSVISENSIVESSVIKNSVIGKNCVIEPFCVLDNNTVVENNCTVKSFTHLSNKLVQK